MSKRALSLLLIAAILLSCAACADLEVPDPEAAPPEETGAATIAPISSLDDRFTVRYDPAATFNPITGTSADNMALTPLLYEGLFVVNGRFEAEPVLCETYSVSEDLKTYTFTLKEGVLFSDGSALTARDVKYTLEQAKAAGRFAGRLGNISSVSAPDDHTVVITLQSPHSRLPVLLDVPVIKSGAIAASCPPGTGPYALDTSGDAPRLVRSPHYRYGDVAPVDVVYLASCTDRELPLRFIAQDIDFFWSDPGGSEEIRLGYDHDAWYYNTSILQYVGFNMRTEILKDASFRRAVSLAVDREAIVREVYQSCALAAPLVLSPKHPLYDAGWVTPVKDVLEEISRIFAALGLEDRNSDGFLEYPQSSSGLPFTLTLVVHDQPYKVAAAEKITNALMSIGIHTELRKLPWEEYLTALKRGEFDLYLADAALPPDFDLSALLAPGGALDYGKAGEEAYALRIQAFLSARGEMGEALAARQLCAAVEQNVPIIPVLYRQYAVHTNRNVVRGVQPTQSSVFYNLKNWKISLGPAG